MRTYRLQILQTKLHNDFIGYVKSQISRAHPDSVLVTAPRRKGLRGVPRPGIKWTDGEVSIANGNYIAFSNAMNQNEYFNCKLIRKDKKRRRRLRFRK